MLELLVIVLVACVLWWAINALMAAFGIGEPIATVVRVVFVIFVLGWLLANVVGFPLPRWHRLG